MISAPEGAAGVTGQSIGCYRVRSRLGVGGMGEVYLAAAVGPDGVERPVAIKLIRELHTRKPAFVDMFVEEAKVSFLLTHPNIVSTYEIGQVDGHTFLVMEYVDGTDLESLIEDRRRRRRGPIPPEFALFIGAQVARGLEHAHALKDQAGRALTIVHRDVSPSNVLLSKSGLVKVTDFGLAKSTLRRVQSEVGQIKGKLAYMAPEQLEGEEVGLTADIYSLGVMLYEMLGGEHPFGDERRLQLTDRFKEIPPLLEHAPSLEPRIVEIVERCMAPDPADRYASARDVGRQLDQCMRELGLGASDYDLSDFVERSMAAATREEAGGPHPFDAALGMELRKVGGSGAAASTFVRAPTSDGAADDGAADDGAAEDDGAADAPPPREASPPARSRALLVAALAILALGVGGGAILIARGGTGTVDGGGASGGRGGRDGAGAAADVSVPARVPAAPGRAVLAGSGGGAEERRARLHVRPVPPGGRVYVEGRLRGQAPLSLSGMEAGRPLTVKIVLRGWRQYSDLVTLAPGGELTIEPRLRRVASPRATGTLSVNSDPWSVVYVDGAKVRNTPLVGHRLPVGKHRVRLYNPVHALSARRSVTIHRDSETRLSVKLRSR